MSVEQERERMMYPVVKLPLEKWSLIASALDVLAAVTTPEKAKELAEASAAIDAGVRAYIEGADAVSTTRCPKCGAVVRLHRTTRMGDCDGTPEAHVHN